MNLALCVDLDGTLVREDVTFLAFKQYTHGNFFRFFVTVWWFLHGRAYLKHKLAEQIDINPEKLHYNSEFLKFLKKEKSCGRKIFLATGCNENYAKLVADHLGFFSGVFASDSSINLIGKAKAKKLVEEFGDHNFVYAGNSSSDIAVWEKSKDAILVTPTANALRNMTNKKYVLFE